MLLFGTFQDANANTFFPAVIEKLLTELKSKAWTKGDEEMKHFVDLATEVAKSRGLTYESCTEIERIVTLFPEVAEHLADEDTATIVANARSQGGRFSLGESRRLLFGESRTLMGTVWHFATTTTTDVTGGANALKHLRMALEKDLQEGAGANSDLATAITRAARLVSISEEVVGRLSDTAHYQGKVIADIVHELNGDLLRLPSVVARAGYHFMLFGVVV